jgi:hypothetical protein
VVDLIHDVINNFQYLAGRYRDVPAMLLLPCLALAMPLLARWIGWSARWLETAALAVAAAIILVMAFVSGSYLANTGYLDHVEASISAVSWLYRNGDPLYPGWTDGEGIYGLQYGPLLFQVTAAALSLGPSILISKLPAFAGFWLACLVLLWTLRPLLPSARLTILPVAIVIIMAGCYWRAAYWVRAEPYLLLFAALALCSLLRLRPVAAAVALGLLGGCAVNMKIHGALYILPYAVALLAATGTTAAALRLAAIGTVCGLLALVLPFLAPNVSLPHYVAFLQATLQHGFARFLLMQNLRFGAVLILPVLLMMARRARGQPQPDLPMGLTYLAAVIIVCGIGAKNGAGPTHLLPFLPAFAYLLVQATRTVRIPGAVDAWTGALSATFLVAAIAYTPGFESNILGLRTWDRLNDDPGVRDEATQLYRDYPTAIMGVGDYGSDNKAEYKVIGVFAGGKLPYDTTTWMDLQKGGVPEHVVDRLVTGCTTPFWIIPKGGEPFSITSPYGPEPMFSRQFQTLFHTGYQPVRDGSYYTVWACKHPA